MFDTSIYNQGSNSPDILGNMMRGYSFGSMIKQNNEANENKEQNSMFKNALSKYLSGDEEAKKQSFSTIAQYNPEMAMQIRNQENANELSKQKYVADMGDKAWDRKYKEKELAIKESDMLNKWRDNFNKNKNIKADQYKVGGFAKRALMAEEDLNNLPSDIGTSKFTDSLQGSDFFPEAFKSDNRKLFDQAQRNFISAVLRRESGAAISDQEMENESKKYFPQPGDGKVVLTQKKRAREQAINNLKAEAGHAMDSIADASRNDFYKRKKGFEIPGIPSAYANDPMKLQSHIEGMSREEKIKALSGSW